MKTYKVRVYKVTSSYVDVAVLAEGIVTGKQIGRAHV